MHLRTILTDGVTVALSHGYAIRNRQIEGVVLEGDGGYELLCGGNFVYFNDDLDEVIARYAHLATRNPNT